MRVAAVLAEATGRLEAAAVVGAGHDARLLLAEALDIDRMRLSLEPDRDLSPAEVAVFELLITRRLSREPVSRILGRRLFWDRSFHITADVLDPRPETEILITEALDGPAPARLLDLGTGSGIIAITLLMEWPEATAVATDLSAAALEVARHNAEMHGVADRITFVGSDWLADVEGHFDLIVSNPPYISHKELGDLSPEVLDHDPAMALTPGGDGLGPYRTIAAQAGDFLTAQGRLAVEIGPTQGNAVAGLFQSAGFQKVRIAPDFDRRDRVVSAVRT